MNAKFSQPRFRIMANIIIFLAVLYIPWWLVSVAVFLCILYFRNFYEAFFFGLLFDTLYGVNIASVHGFQFIFSSVFLVLVFAVDFLKGKVRV